MEGTHQIKTPHKLFNEHKHLATATLYKMLGQPHNVARSKSLEYDDLLQYSRLGLWQACLKYDKQNSSFQSFAINHMRWSIQNGLNRNSNIFKINPNNTPDEKDVFKIIDMDSSPHGDSGSDMLLSEMISSDEDIEKKTLDKFIALDLLSDLSKREKEIILLKSKDNNDAEVAKLLGLSRQYVNRRVKNIHNKMKSRKEELYEHCRY